MERKTCKHLLSPAFPLFTKSPALFLVNRLLWVNLKSGRVTVVCMSYLMSNYRSSLLEVVCKKVVLRNFAKFAVKHLCQSLFFDKVAVTPPVAASETIIRLYQTSF